MSRTIWTWGTNQYGQIGDGTVGIDQYGDATYFGSHPNENRSSPTSILNPPYVGNWVRVDGGGSHSVAIAEDGTMWAWGGNWNGMLGDGTTETRSSPVSVIGGITDWVEMCASSQLTLGIRKDGTLWSWGSSFGGALGQGDGAVSKSSPELVVGGFTDWFKVDSITHNTAGGIRRNGTLWMWGTNGDGKLGLNQSFPDIISVSSPVSIVGGILDWVDLRVGASDVVALRNNGTIWAWGRNNHGGLGDGTTISRSSPVPVIGGITDWVAIEQGNPPSGGFVLAIRDNGSLWSWGSNNNGQLGDNSRNNRSSPGLVLGGFTDWIALGTADHFSFGIRQNGTLWSWGSELSSSWPTPSDPEYGNYATGLLGANAYTGRSSPGLVVGGFTDWIAVQGQWNSMIALRGDPIAEPSYVYTWGSNLFGGLGIDIPGTGDPSTQAYRSSPGVIVGESTNWVDVDSYFYSSGALKSSGELLGWGRFRYGNGGDGIGGNVDRESPSLVISTESFKSFSKGYAHTLALDGTNKIWSWGSNWPGVLGDGTTIPRSSPVSVIGGISDWVSITGGFEDSFGIRSNGTLWGWGSNSWGSVGDGTTSMKSSPVSVIGGFTDWIDVSTTYLATIALRNNGTLWSWGRQLNGELGSNLPNNSGRSSPAQILPFADWKSIDASAWHAGGIREDGTLWMWGFNNTTLQDIPSGQLGDGTSITRSSPVSVVGGFTDWDAVGCAKYHTVGIRKNGTLWAWGHNWAGQLGDATIVDRSSPVSVVGGFTDWVTADGNTAITVALRGGALVDQGPPRFTGKARVPLVIQPFQRKLMELPEGIHLSLKGNSIINAIEINGEDANTISDIEYKENIRDLQNAMDIVNRLRGVSFRWKDTDEKSIGMIAQEVEEILPEVVFDSGDTKSISYDVIVSVLIEGIKEHQHKIDRLRNAISKYEKMLGIKDGK